MSTFADSSALVKLYADEAGHEIVREIDVPVVSQLARVEVPAALWRKHRIGELAAAATAILVAQFDADWFGTDEEPARFVVVALSESILESAARLTGTHRLRAYDAVQLATALAARTADSDCTGLAAFDRVLRDSAVVEHFTLVPPG